MTGSELAKDLKLRKSNPSRTYEMNHLDARLGVLGVETVSIGTVDASIAHPREIFKGAILNGAVSIILVHNHPSGVPEPSSTDKQKLVKGRGKLTNA